MLLVVSMSSLRKGTLTQFWSISTSLDSLTVSKELAMATNNPLNHGDLEEAKEHMQKCARLERSSHPEP